MRVKRTTPPPKPVSRNVRPQITRLPPLTTSRRRLRRWVHQAARLLVALFTHVTIKGLENFPDQGPALVVVNHLGDADAVLALAYFPIQIDALAKAELYDFPFLGRLMDAYGVIWVHRGRPDRRALRAALVGLKEGRLMGIAPEGRESLTGALEEGMGGAAYLALEGGAPILPVTFTGTENDRLYPNMKRLRRTEMTMTVGPMFRLEDPEDRRQAVEKGTRRIMQTLASQLPLEYQGAYRQGVEGRDGREQPRE